LIPWSIATGLAMRAYGLSEGEAVAMNLFVYAATAQLGALPLIVAKAPLSVVWLTAAILNLRFVIYSAAIAPVFRGERWFRRALASYWLVDVLFIALGPLLLAEKDPKRRWTIFSLAGLWCWGLWQVFGLVGIFAAAWLPVDWPLTFMGTIALLVLLVPLVRESAMRVTAAASAAVAVLAHDLPMKTGVIAAVLCGLLAGGIWCSWQKRRLPDEERPDGN
jgi:predicted branched-subunit amino acid permease